jgi:dihydrofolate reductase
MSINAIVACDLGFGIGNRGKLPWPKNDDDMKWFRDCTLGQVVVMGHSTWKSIGSKPLPYRTNVVITGSNIDGPDHIESGDMKNILTRLKNKYQDKTIWIIGGADIYKQAFPFCDRLFLTRFNRIYDCDTYIDEKILDQFPFIVMQKTLNNGIKFQERER